MEPLASKIRPKKFSNIYGQDHLIGTNGPIFRMVKNNKLQSLVLYGDPGIGKTTLAIVIANELNKPYQLFNASNDNKATLKDIIDNHSDSILIIDEIHRMKKDIQDYLLPHLEDGSITIIGLTTINPYHSLNPPVRSRTLIYRLKSLQYQDLEKIFYDGLEHLQSHHKFSNDAKKYLISCANGDVRSLLNYLEVTVNTIDTEQVSLDDVQRTIQIASVSIDKDGENYYDTLSGLQKSIRGSDVDAALHYLARLLMADDLLPLIRRLYAICYEDIGLANPGLGPKVHAACEIALDLGMPEAKLPLSVIVIDLALSPKSNSAYLAVSKAMEDVEKGKTGPIPLHLKNTYSFDPSQKSYLYPHDYPGSWVNQQYLPDIIKDAKYYDPKETGKYEKALKERLEAIEKAKNN
ncbi:MAG TPA: replication-associated recombination protein A [Bacilli bacterium]|nr:replication-associated recombination protein A [Bacilli bacterium]